MGRRKVNIIRDVAIESTNLKRTFEHFQKMVLTLLDLLFRPLFSIYDILDKWRDASFEFDVFLLLLRKV